MIHFCSDHSFIRSDKTQWKKVKNLKKTLLRLGKPAFVAKCPDCEELQRIRIAFLKQRDTW